MTLWAGLAFSSYLKKQTQTKNNNKKYRFNLSISVHPQTHSLSLSPPPLSVSCLYMGVCMWRDKRVAQSAVVFILCWHLLCDSPFSFSPSLWSLPWYNRTGWLGVKHQLTDLLSLVCSHQQHLHVLQQEVEAEHLEKQVYWFPLQFPSSGSG